MSNTLKLDKESVRNAATSLSEAIEEYQGFGEEPFESEIALLGSMNTDFLAKFKTMLENINRSNAKTLSELEEAAKKAVEIVDTFEGIDTSTAEKIKYSQEK